MLSPPPSHSITVEGGVVNLETIETYGESTSQSPPPPPPLFFALSSDEEDHLAASSSSPMSCRR